MKNDHLKDRIKEPGFTLIEVMIVFAIALIIAVPFLRYFYREEVQEIERQIFNLLGVGEIGQFIIYGILGTLVIYLIIRPDVIEAKKRNRPLISKPVKFFVLFSIVLAAALIYIGLA